MRFMPFGDLETQGYLETFPMGDRRLQLGFEEQLYRRLAHAGSLAIWTIVTWDIWHTHGFYVQRLGRLRLTPALVTTTSGAGHDAACWRG
jgi:hypothetical protein